ncbi:hypothetical protein DICPUDRAFT_90349 [Dictyostelium purpureum]|uniref:Uncharacterized protein n=1 Tax=Dictyostelium purpureum TaxID=5786 RepID=F1A1Z0_DICPU|nr:uncharacterized protein DICPUDRAFT_90349 [Dictyostelium purpureum]EGC29793.1 hypothetical protein DICPUDRAFT_90349 [Dictyostelium purpureum]|eukprot:XP_003293679.1 hypothetical protein DICPUDRAFT_90349 [Dictyostelium purpureum]
MKSILLLICIILCSTIYISNADYLEYRKVHLVDKTEPLPNGNVNYIFRGNEPKVNINGTNYFAYEELINCLVNNSYSLGVKLRPSFSKTFFNANPEYGQFNTNITLGDLIDPNFVPEKELEKWGYRIPFYHEILNTQHDLPVVNAVVIELYLNYSFKQAMEWDYSVAGRRIMINHQWAAQWYCYYLKYAENQDIDCTSPPLFL